MRFEISSASLLLRSISSVLMCSISSVLLCYPLRTASTMELSGKSGHTSLPQSFFCAGPLSCQTDKISDASRTLMRMGMALSERVLLIPSAAIICTCCLTQFFFPPFSWEAWGASAKTYFSFVLSLFFMNRLIQPPPYFQWRSALRRGRTAIPTRRSGPRVNGYKWLRRRFTAMVTGGPSCSSSRRRRSHAGRRIW